MTSNTIPNEAFFVNILNRAKSTPWPIINDTTLGINVGYTQLLTDVLSTRDALRESIPDSLFDEQGLLLESRSYIGLHTTPNYEFYVAALAILALGGAIIAPLRPEFDPESISRMLQKFQASAVVLGAQQLPLTAGIKASAASRDHALGIVPVKIKQPAPADLAALNLSIKEDQVIPEHRPSLLVHTSGTATSPKSVVQTRRLINLKFPPTSPNDRLLVYETMNWISAHVNLLVRIVTASQCDILPTYPGPAVIWEHLRQNRITSFAGVAHTWGEMGKYFLEHLDKLPAGEREEYVRGAQAIQRPFLASASPPAWLLPFWKKTFDRDIQIGYVATELGVISMLTTPGTDHIKRCLGKPLPGITVKLANGDHGEIRIKTPYIFSHYLDNPAATKAAFDEEGFFKTGDAAHREGDQYVFDGRLGTDFLELDTGMVSMVNLDLQLVSKPYLSEAYGIPLEGASKLGMLVRFNKSSDKTEDALSERLRTDVAAIIAPHTAPTVIRVLRDGETAPKTSNRKIWRRKVNHPFFSEGS
ncbi:uncharacterized protein ASPGLDRAFT_168610 [Aspergillus glaucus CBS 516.65]|uniref:AMP-dependent synthetase/ligase domain-containing protein n=1 Tax=Aspergillus glaucus CBS 516.65 TaxID=1160497 RepID=A0A1L9VNI7_ASPGL|nr:hypothetical protein ASPGLDRAFT_168610 [Aspergillus glaucus CBS 516.65]OJJ85466.1 hypothetical protein ASPGLDRAFT_168610 [Aspergillus glaucus CBS 516.65]